MSLTNSTSLEFPELRPQPLSAAQKRRRGLVKTVTPKMIADLLAIGDAATILTAAILAKYAYLDLYLATANGLGEYFAIGIVGMIFASILFRTRHLYDTDSFHHRMPVRASAIFVAITTMFFSLTALGYLLKIGQDYSRGWMIVWAGFSLIGVIGIRTLAAATLAALVRRGYFRQRVAILGDRQDCRDFADTLGYTGYEIVGIFDGANDQDETSQLKVGLAGLIEYCRSNPVDFIVVMVPEIAQERIVSALDELGALATQVCLYTDLVGRHLRQANIRRLGSTNVIEIRKSALVGWNLCVKRVMDISIAGAALILLAPLLGFIALAVKLSSPGPVIFRQQRHGLNHQVINVLKFRSMSVLEDSASSRLKQATKNDTRITRVGRFLRRTSLDELPQFLNVFTGEMSLVGPRPHALIHNSKYGKIIERYANRHKVKPGITGWAQVNGWRGETGDPTKMENRIKFDLDYIDRWSAWLDLKIVFWLTGLALLKNENVY